MSSSRSARSLTERVRDDMLHLARMLGRAQHQHALVFLRHGVGDLAFQVELLLPADIQLALDRMRRAFERLLELAAREPHRRQHVRLRGLGRLRGQDRRQFVVSDFGQARGAAGLIVGFGDHDEDRLADVHHQSIGKNRIVVDDRAAVVDAGDIGGGEHGDHAGGGAHLREVDRGNPGVRFRRQAERAMQGALHFRDIVGIGSLAEHVQRGRFMRARHADRAPRSRFQLGDAGVVHAASPSARVANALTAADASGCSLRVSNQKRRSRFCAAFMR
jgi:hypothetical protein